MLNVIWEMETNDPDDFLTLLFLLGHPAIHLKAVNVTPGTPEQIGLVRHAITTWFQQDIPIGAFNMAYQKPCVSSWHYQAYGPIPPSQDAEPGAEIVRQLCDEQTTYLIGAPLKNLGQAIRFPANDGGNPLKVGRVIIQGGFAGEGVIPEELQLDKFKGRRTCESFNLNHAAKETLALLSSPLVKHRYFVAKNVCHRVVYDHTLHQHFSAKKESSLSHALIWQGMEVYLQDNPQGKLLHDLLAACCAIDMGIGTWAEVEVYREKGQWGATLSPGSNTWIITDYDHEKFLNILNM